MIVDFQALLRETGCDHGVCALYDHQARETVLQHGLSVWEFRVPDDFIQTCVLKGPVAEAEEIALTTAIRLWLVACHA